MTADDIEQQPRGSQRFDLWLAKQPLSTHLGEFEVELYEPPDQEILACAQEMVEAVTNCADEILGIIYDHYQQIAVDKLWMRSCEVPNKLPRHRIARYLRGRSITIRRDKKRTVTGLIFISPQWETEHGISLEVRNGIVIPYLD